MNIQGEVGFFVESFYAIPESFSWTLSIRRLDSKEDPEFGKYHKEPVPASFLRQLTPKWKQLSWEEIRRPANLEKMFPREITAECPPYRLSIIVKSSSKETLEQLVEQFKAVLGS